MTASHEILIVDDDPGAISVLGSMLRGMGRVRFATSGADALLSIRDARPDLVLLDLEMPGMSGLEVCKAIKQDPDLGDVPVIFVTSHDCAEDELSGLAAGAVDFIAKPPRAALVAARARVHLRLKELSDALRSQATTDSLTGLPNRRHLDESLQREWRHAQRNGSSLAALLIDLDYFKGYNDHYGHVEGDTCLRSVSDVMRQAAHRGGDLLARYGGEEFAMLLPGTDEEGAKIVAARLIELVDDAAIPHVASRVASHVTISVGATACVPKPDGGVSASATDLWVTADRALYLAKQSGRHQLRALAIGSARGDNVEAKSDATASMR